MPKFTYTSKAPPELSASGPLEEFRPSVFLEVSKEQLKAVEVGKPATIKLKGTVRSVNMREGKGFDGNSLELELDESEILGSGVFEEMAEEEEA